MAKILLLFLTLFSGCAELRKSQSHEAQEKTNKHDILTYRVYKIDSINSHYLIYAERGDTLFKIVSKKEAAFDCENIVLGGRYLFSLSSIWKTEIRIGNVNVSPSVTPQVNCLSFDDSTRICLERDSINDLHYAKNLKGLCFETK